MKYLRQTYIEKFKFNWVPCIFILLNLAALSRKPSGLFAHLSTWKWRLSSAPPPPLLMVQLCLSAEAPRPPFYPHPQQGRGREDSCVQHRGNFVLTASAAWEAVRRAASLRNGAAVLWAAGP